MTQKTALERIPGSTEVGAMEMLDYVCLYIQQYGESPTSRELEVWYRKNKKDVKHTSVHVYKRFLKAKGFITKTEKPSVRNILVLDRRYVDKYKLYQEPTK